MSGCPGVGYTNLMLDWIHLIVLSVVKPFRAVDLKYIRLVFKTSMMILFPYFKAAQGLLSHSNPLHESK